MVNILGVLIIALLLPVVTYQQFPVMITYDTAVVRLGSEFQLKINQTSLIEPGDMQVTLLNIADSRCPSGVVCIWQGQVTAKVKVTQDDHNFILNLTRTEGQLNDTASASFGTYSASLLSVDPYLVKGSNNADYVASMVVYSNNSSDSSVLVISEGRITAPVGTLGLANNSLVRFVAGWDTGVNSKGGILIETAGSDNDQGSFKPVKAFHFLPAVDGCTHGSSSAQCVSGVIVKNSGFSNSDGSLHFEIDKNNGTFYSAFNFPNSISGSGEIALNITRIKVVTQPATPIVVLTEGQRYGPLLVEHIFPDHVEGLNYREYPIATNTGMPVTLKIGDRVSNGCTVSLTLVRIDGGKVAYFAVNSDFHRL